MQNMFAENKTKKHITLIGIVGFFLALAPILDPYVFLKVGSGFTIKINDIIMLVLSVFCFAENYKNKQKTNYLIILLSGLTFITIIANMYNDTSVGSSLKNVIVYFIYAVALTYIWKTPCREIFFRWIGVFASVAAVIVLLQFFAGYLSLPMWDGKIPLLELGGYDGWAGYIDKNTGAVRPNGVFQEASYVGIYLSIAYAQAFKEGKLKRIILYAVAMLVTTSIVSIACCIVVTIYVLIARKKMQISAKMSQRTFFVVMLVVIGLFMFISVNDAARESFTYILTRITNIGSDLEGTRMSSTKYRLLGHIDLFSLYDVMQKLFGLGVAQYSVYFDVSSYSNVWVTTILNSGVLGIVCLVFVLAGMLRHIKTENKVFFIILLLVFSGDYQWFSWYFFYMFSACLLELSTEKSEL